jgi:hypothetical protein
MSVIVPHRLRAPQLDGAVLAQPELAQAGRLIDRNRHLLASGPIEVLGRSLAELRPLARRSALLSAQEYLRSAGEPIPSTDEASLLLSGHQPELFHPGVWVKHFALNGLARQHGASPINLIVDNDTAKTTALPLPATTDSLPHLLRVPFDRWSGEVPYEERPVHDETLFASFPQRARQPWNFTPLLDDFWREALRQAQRTNLLGERFVAARRTYERRWGCHNLELPVSRVCVTEPFAWFACHLLANLLHFHAVYNESVRAYRRLYGIRSRNHPVPELATDGDWREVPFWGWRTGELQRGRLFCRLTPTTLELRAGGTLWPALPLPTPASATRAVCAWQELERQGYKVRSRALTNTLYARLFVSDLFIHGIGGGKYDELTDEIIRRFYGLQPPGFLVLSATLRLPLPRYPVKAEDCRRLAHELRDLHWNPQRHPEALTTAGPEALSLARDKTRWIGREEVNGRERHRILRQLTEELQVRLRGRESELRQELTRCQEYVQANEVLRRRDYAFCLFPEALLREFCTRFLHPSASP